MSKGRKHGVFAVNGNVTVTQNEQKDVRKDDKQIKEALETIFNQMRIAGNRPRTIQSYEYIFNQFGEICHVEYVEDIDIDKLYHYLDVLEVKPATKLIRLKSQPKVYYLDIEKLKELVKANSNFEKIREELWNFVDDVDNVNFDHLDTELNEVISAEVYGMDIREVSDFEIKDSSFGCIVEVIGYLNIKDEGYGEEICDSAEILFNVAVSGFIKDDEVVIEEVEGIKQL